VRRVLGRREAARVEGAVLPALLPETVVRSPVDAYTVDVVDAGRQAVAEPSHRVGRAARIPNSDQGGPQHAACCMTRAIRSRHAQENI